MSVGAITPVSSGSAAVYAALSPYLNGTANVTDAQPVAPAAATAPAPAAPIVATPAPAPDPATSAATAPPFLNPAIPIIAAISGPLLPAALYGLPAAPAVPPVAPVSAYPRVTRVESGA